MTHCVVPTTTGALILSPNNHFTILRKMGVRMCVRERGGGGGKGDGQIA